MFKEIKEKCPDCKKDMIVNYYDHSYAGHCKKCNLHFTGNDKEKIKGAV